jgi:putative transposase
MPNHVHFIAVPHNEYSMARTFNTCHMLYSQYFNRKNGLIGHLWQGRFFSCALDERYLYAAVRYIESNPVRAKLVKQPEDWKWSSARIHLRNCSCSGILKLEDIDKYMEIKSWKGYLTQQEDAAIIKHIRANTLSGKPLGDDRFLVKLEKLSGKVLKSLPRGRPKKKK